MDVSIIDKKKKKAVVTNAMRRLKASGIEFETVEYEAAEVGEHFGERIAEITGLAPEMSFKTLVLRGDKTGYMTACVPVCREVNLKKLAGVSGNKKTEPVHVRELLALTGYIRGGVSPIGMKKQFPTYVDKSAETFERVAVSGGTCGVTLLLTPSNLKKACGCRFEDIAATE